MADDTPGDTSVAEKPAETAARPTGAEAPAPKAPVAKPAPAAQTEAKAPAKLSPDQIRNLFETGKYPYSHKISTKEYEQRKRLLQIELLKVQEWVKTQDEKIVVIFEGRDAAGKGGTIKRFMEHLNPRAARTVALEKPTETELGQWYFQRYVKHLPSSGEMVFHLSIVPSSSVSRPHREPPVPSQRYWSAFSLKFASMSR